MEIQEETDIVEWKDRRTNRGKTETGLTHECGVFGAIGNETWLCNSEIAQFICIGLQALQHRGQESTGIVTSEGTNDYHVHKGMGLVKHVFSNESISKLPGFLGIGHTRYSTSARSEPVNCQPFVVHSMHGALAVAHNGELVNAAVLRKQIMLGKILTSQAQELVLNLYEYFELEKRNGGPFLEPLFSVQEVLDRGVGLSTHSDSELITQALCLIPPDGEVNGPDWPARIRHLMQLAPLSYSLCIMLKDRIYAVRDPYGNRPLCLGVILAPNQELNNGIVGDIKPEGWVVSSESCAFMSVTRFWREVQPGEIVEMTHKGIKTIDIVPPPEGKLPAFCIFEYVYFSRPNSIFEGQEVYTARVHCGMQLAIEHPVEADIVGSVPESGNSAAFGFAQQSKIPLGELLTKNTYVGRTFIQPNNRLRQMNVALKFSPILRNVKDKRIILIDDSIVRGNTVGPIIKLLRRAGAKEVHIRVASPPLKYPCYMGINIPTREELIMNKLKDTKEFAKQVDAESIEYLSVDGLVKAVRREIQPTSKKTGHCTACLTGEYPGGVPEELDW